ncbi:Apoptosis-inducing factor 2 [Podila humilis]|nr:Apoptosis-inducing factor 2 [Podila humilis]
MKHIVVVGGSYGGVACVNELKKRLPHDMEVAITLIESRDARYHCVASYRAMVKPAFAKNLWIPYTNLFPKDSMHKVVRGTVTEVHRDHVLVTSTAAESHKVTFDFLVIATGSSIPAPAKLKVSSSEEGIAQMNKIRDDLVQSKSIVIVGGGACGTEFAGETKYAFPDKHVTLIEGMSSLVDYPRYPQAFKDRAREYLEQRGVEVILGETAEIEGLSRENPCQRAPRAIRLKNSNRTIESDMQFFSIGMQVDTSFIKTLETSVPVSSSSTMDTGTTTAEDVRQKRDSVMSITVDSIIDKKTKALHVKSTLQLDHPDFPNIFAVGDIANADPVPTAQAAAVQGGVAARNIVTLLSKMMSPSRENTCCGDGKLENYVPVKELMLLCMDPTGGVSNLPVVGTHFGGWAAWFIKSQDLFSGRFWREMNMPKP